MTTLTLASAHRPAGGRSSMPESARVGAAPAARPVRVHVCASVARSAIPEPRVADPREARRVLARAEAERRELGRAVGRAALRLVLAGLPARGADVAHLPFTYEGWREPVRCTLGSVSV